MFISSDLYSSLCSCEIVGSFIPLGVFKIIFGKGIITLSGVCAGVTHRHYLILHAQGWELQAYKITMSYFPQ